jgi:hypothetical protein
MIGAPAATAEPTGAGWRRLVVTAVLKVVGLGAGLHRLAGQPGLEGVPAAVAIVTVTLAATFRVELAAVVTGSGTGGSRSAEVGAPDQRAGEQPTESVGTEAE